MSYNSDMSKRQFNVRLDENTLSELEQIASELRRERGDYRLGMATVIEEVLREYLNLRRAKLEQPAPVAHAPPPFANKRKAV